MKKSRAWWMALVVVSAGCDTVTPGSLVEVTVRDDPPEEAVAATAVYGGGLALAINRSCESANLDSFEVLCGKASVLHLDESGALRWTYPVPGPVRVTALVEVSPGVLAFGGARKVGSAEPAGFVEAIQDGRSVWVRDLPPDSAVRALAAGLDGVWVAGRTGTLGVLEVLDPRTGDRKGQWVLDDPGAPPEQDVVESVVTAMAPAPERGVFAVGTMKRVGGERDVWVARLTTTNQPAQNDSWSGHLGSPGFPDEPGAFAVLGGGLFLAARDPNPDADRVTFYRFDPVAIANGPQTTLVLDNAKYRWIRAEADGRSGGAVLAGAWRPAANGAFEPRALRVDAMGAPDPAWKTGSEWGIQVHSEEGRATFVAAGSGASPLVGGWFMEQGKPVGFLMRLD